MTIGQRIKIRREELNMSQDDLAKKVGYKSRSSINKIELDLYSLKQSKIKAIADALETTPSYIMGWDEEAEEAKKLTASLPEVYRKVFTLRALGDMSFREIGRRFGKSENWACVTYHRARKMLREKMENARRER